MSTKQYLRSQVARWPYAAQTLLASLAAFGAYTCMYAFRKAFAAGTFTGGQYFHVNYKVWLVIAQVAGYTLSKFYGIRFIAELKHQRRAQVILLLIGISWLALLAFAVLPAPLNVICLFINGFPLGMIWGLVVSYLEGRRATELMAAVLSISLIFASGFVKTAGRTLISNFHVSEHWMPFMTGALFVLPLLIFIGCLELIPPPTAMDMQLRTRREPMSADDRQRFLLRFLPGIVLTVIIYVMLTVLRDVRDNFEVEIWASVHITDNSIFTKIDSMISFIVLCFMGMLILVRHNLNAFSIIHVLIITGCLLACVATVLFNHHQITPIAWMTLAGLGLYMGYVPYNAIFFERMIATFHARGNVGFIMYVADAMGYLGSISMLLIKELGKPGISWGSFFNQAVIIVGLLGGIGGILSLIYFVQSAHKRNKQNKNPSITILPV